MNNKIKPVLISLSKSSRLFRKILRTTLNFKNTINKIPYRFYKVDDKYIVFESYMGRNFSCSPKALFEEIRNDERFNNYKLIVALKDIKKHDIILDDNIIIIRYRSIDYYKYYNKAKYWITNSRLPNDLYKKKNQVYVQCWHGTPLKRLGHDIIDNTNNAMNTKLEIKQRYDSETKKIDYFLSPSKYASSKFKTAFNLDKLKYNDILLELGYPRNDYLINYHIDDVNSIKSKLNIPLNKKVIFYAPTWRDNEHESTVGYTYNVRLNFEYLMEYLKKEFVILYRPHYLASNNFDYSKYRDFVIDISQIQDINHLYIISDILITDYSSVFFDYAILKRPIIFYMYDLEEYVNQIRGFYTDMTDLPGKIFHNEKEIISTVLNLEKYKLEYEEKLIELNQKYNYLEDGKSSKRVIEEIFFNRS